MKRGGANLPLRDGGKGAQRRRATTRVAPTGAGMDWGMGSRPYRGDNGKGGAGLHPIKGWFETNPYGMEGNGARWEDGAGGGEKGMR